MLIIQIAGGILLALAVLGVFWLAYKALRWTVRKGDAEWLSSSNKKT